MESLSARSGVRIFAVRAALGLGTHFVEQRFEDLMKVGELLVRGQSLELVIR